MKKKRPDIMSADTIPAKDPIATYRIRNFVSEVEDFLNEYYRGSFISEGLIGLMDNVRISKNAFAHIMRLALKSTNNEQLVKVMFGDDGRTFTVHLEGVKYGENAITEFKKLADGSGLSIEFCDNGIKLTASIIKVPSLSVRAVSQRIIYNTLVSVFEI